MKKLACLLLTLALLCAATLALATASKTTDDLTTVTRVRPTADDEGVLGAIEELAHILLVPLADMTPEAAEQHTALLAELAVSVPPIAFFGEDILAAITETWPDMDPANLMLHELIQMIALLDERLADDLTDTLVATCAFPTQYAPGQRIVVLIGVPGGVPELDARHLALPGVRVLDAQALAELADPAIVDALVWYLVPAEVLEDGSVDISLPMEILRAALDRVVFMAVLAEFFPL